VPIRWLVGPGCRRGLSVLARAVSRRAPGSWTTPGLTKASRLRSRQCGLPVTSTRSAPELRFSKLNSRPVDASVYASPGTSRHPAQDSRSRWFATPFSWGSFIPDCTPVYPDDCACLRARLSMIPRVRRQRPRKCSIPAATMLKPASTQPASARRALVCDYSGSESSPPRSLVRFSNFVNSLRKTRFTRPVGPLRCLARSSSAMPRRSSRSGL